MHGVTEKSPLRGEKVFKDALLVPGDLLLMKKKTVISYIFTRSEYFLRGSS